MRIMIILLCCGFAVGCSGVKAALDTGASIAFGSGIQTGLGVSNSLSSGDGSFGSSNVDLTDGSDSSKDFADLDKHFDNVENLTQQASGNVELPSNLAYSYFEVLGFFHKNVNNASVNSRNENGKTPLVIAIEQNNLEMVEFLMSKNAKVNEDAMNAANNIGNSQILESLGQ